MRSMISENPDGIIVVDHSGLIIFENQAAIGLLSKSGSSLVGQSFGFPIVTGCAANINTLLNRSVEMRIVQIDWNETPALQVTLRDVTEREVLLHDLQISKAAAEAATREQSALVARLGSFNEELLASEAQVRLLLESTGEGIIGMDKEGRCILCNPAAVRMLGLTDSDSLLGKYGHQMFHHHRSEGGEYPIKECPIYLCSVHGRSEHIENEVFYRTDGTSFAVEYRVNPTIKSGVITGVVVCFSDITIRQQRERDLIQAKLAAEMANKAKSEFLAVMSHELRTPLNAIMGFSEIIRDQIMGPVGNIMYTTYASDIYNSGDHLLSIINDILDMSRIASGSMIFEPTDVPINPILSVCERLYMLLAEKHGVKIKFNRAEPDFSIFADERALYQIICNLASNAIKFTPYGGNVSIFAENLMEHGFCLIVSDTGVGILKDDINRIIQPFEQIDNGFKRTHEGAGLGLALVNGLIKLHNGKLTIHSSPGKGSTFTVWLPRKATLVNRMR